MSIELNISNKGPAVKDSICVRDEFKSRVALMVAAIVGFVVALAVNDLVISVLNKYFDKDAIAVKIYYAIFAFVVAIFVIWYLVKYVMPDSACNRWQ